MKEPKNDSKTLLNKNDKCFFSYIYIYICIYNIFKLYIYIINAYIKKLLLPFCVSPLRYSMKSEE